MVILFVKRYLYFTLQVLDFFGLQGSRRTKQSTFHISKYTVREWLHANYTVLNLSQLIFDY